MILSLKSNASPIIAAKSYGLDVDQERNQIIEGNQREWRLRTSPIASTLPRYDEFP